MTYSKRFRQSLWLLVTAAAVLAVFFAAASFKTYASDDCTYHETKEEAAADLREHMKQRDETVTIGITGSTDQEGLKALIGEIVELATEHSGVPDEGDYLRFQFASYRGTAQTTYYDWEPVVEIDYELEYYDTAEQEDEVDKKVKEILESLDLEDKTDYEKIKAICDNICINTEYAKTEDGDNIIRTAYGTLINGKAVCQGYSLALYRLLLETGIDNRIIFGEATDSKGNTSSHTWNIVKLNDVYYYTDLTWDDNTISHDFLLRPADAGFEDNHIADDEYTGDAFAEQYPMATEEYIEYGEEIEAILSLPKRLINGIRNSIRLLRREKSEG